MFRPEEEGEFTYIPKPGNPNLRFKVAKVDGKSTVNVRNSPDGTQTVQVENATDKPDTAVVPFKQFEDYIDSLIRRAFQQYYTFIGYIEAETGQHKGYYAHYDTIIKGSSTYGEFRAKNHHLGPEFLDRFSSIVKSEKSANLIGPQIGGVNIDDVPPPAWIVCKNDTVLQFILKTSTISAIEMAAMELGYPEDWRPLVESKSVAHMFAKFVAHRFFVAKGGVASPAGIDGGGQVQYRISSGFSTTQAANSKWLLGCKEWFKDVYKIVNPTSEDDALREMVQLESTIPVLADDMRYKEEIMNNAAVRDRDAATNEYIAAKNEWKTRYDRYISLLCYRPYTLKK